MKDRPNSELSAALGGPGWTARKDEHRSEIGRLWRSCGIRDEWSPLRQVLLHRPGDELSRITDPGAVHMLSSIDQSRAQDQHDGLAEAYRREGVEVHYVEPARRPTANLMFVADLFFMTPEGAILARPASTVRAGEERWVAARLAGLGIPILKTLRGSALFEGADAAWLDSANVLIGIGLRTNPEGARQVAAVLAEMGVRVIQLELPPAAMHLMGAIRLVDGDLAITRSDVVPREAAGVLMERGFRNLSIPGSEECAKGMALNFVTLGPKRILMPRGNPETQALLEEAGIRCHPVAIDELAKGAGGIGCLTGIVQRAHRSAYQTDAEIPIPG